MPNIKKRIAGLIATLQSGIYEKDTETSLSLLAALAGESVLLLGPPGVAKSMVARRLKRAFVEARSFEYLMSRFSTPDELFGPVSIARLKESDRYERATEGYLPTADVVFLDEIWKAGPAIQNTLLTVMNEKLFRNGEKEMRLPLKLLVAASNELPAKDEGLEALWDRFLIRIVCRNIQDEETFRRMLTSADEEDLAAPSAVPEKAAPATTEVPAEAITPEEYARWQAEARQLPLSPGLLDAISHTRKALQRVEPELSELPRSIYVSDRRWKHIARLLRTSAYVQGRNEAESEDLLPLYHCLWNDPEEIEEVRRITLQAIFAPIKRRTDTLAQGVKADLRACRAQEALSKALRENDRRDEDLVIADRFFYRIENHGTGNTCVFITDFKRMPIHQTGMRGNAPAQGLIYTDPLNPKRRIVRMFSPDWKGVLEKKDVEHVTLARDDRHIYINGLRFGMLRRGCAIKNPEAGNIGLFQGLQETPPPPAGGGKGTPASSARYEEEAEEICNELDTLKKRLENNLFANHGDCLAAGEAAKALYKQIALTRADIRKLLYDEA